MAHRDGSVCAVATKRWLSRVFTRARVLAALGALVLCVVVAALAIWELGGIDKYGGIEPGMARGEVVLVMGAEGTAVSCDDVAGVVTEVFRWRYYDWFIDVTFRDGRVASKSLGGSE
jgi:hypothetical protein